MNSAIKMFIKSEARFPGRIAVTDEWGESTFSGLKSAALAIGTGLLGDDTCLRPVIVYLPKSIAALACYMGAMYSGDPYVPVDVNIPVKRLQSIIDDLGPGHLITNHELAPSLSDIDFKDVRLHLYDDLIAIPADEAACMKRVASVIDTDPIYIMYTSGSTGAPKGVTIPHRGIIDYSEWLEETFDFDEGTVLGNQAAFFFDNSTLDIFTMFRTGAKMVIIPEVLYRFPSKLPDYIAETGINTIFWVPTVMMSVANSGVLDNCSMPQLKKVLFCGEPMPNRQLNQWRRAFPDLLYANLYGPTEITDVCSYYIVDREFADTDILPIGIACQNMRVVILKEDGTKAGNNEIGELCVIGTGLSLGYWNKPELTRRVFTQNPLTGFFDERLYHTGDLGYWQDDGNIIILGRLDSQIKLRGNRIELGDIETAARSMAAIENACAIFDTEKQEIVLFAESAQELRLRTVNMELKKLIPSYMLPGRLVRMREFPLTPNGKIDRVTLKTQI